MVCGSSQGIGKATAIELAKLGASITLVARDAKKLELVKNELTKISLNDHEYLAINFENREEVKKVVSNYIINRPIDILVNNTGGPRPGKAIDALEEDFEKTFSAHLLCNHLLVKLVVPHMKKSKYGRIINIISTSVKQPIPGLGVSNTIRAAVANWSKTLAGELAPFGITVNNVLPGATKTSRLKEIIDEKAGKMNQSIQEIEKHMMEEIPTNRFAQPEEIAYAVVFLASPAASYITGVNIPVDGGRTLSL
jgi:3-oxoacyl-[acyl-carrier protein] reductase